MQITGLGDGCWTGRPRGLQYEAHDVASEATTAEIVAPECKILRASCGLKKFR